MRNSLYGYLNADQHANSIKVHFTSEALVTILPRKSLARVTLLSFLTFCSFKGKINILKNILEFNFFPPIGHCIYHSFVV